MSVALYLRTLAAVALLAYALACAVVATVGIGCRVAGVSFPVGRALHAAGWVACLIVAAAVLQAEVAG